MNERDERLGKLIEAVRQHPSGSLSWRKAMNQLLIEIQQLPGLARSAHPDYLEALDDTLLKLLIQEAGCELLYLPSHTHQAQPTQEARATSERCSAWQAK